MGCVTREAGDNARNEGDVATAFAAEKRPVQPHAHAHAGVAPSLAGRSALDFVQKGSALAEGHPQVLPLAAHEALGAGLLPLGHL